MLPVAAGFVTGAAAGVLFEAFVFAGADSIALLTASAASSRDLAGVLVRSEVAVVAALGGGPDITLPLAFRAILLWSSVTGEGRLF